MKRCFILLLTLLLLAAPIIAQDAPPIKIGVAVATTTNVALFGQEQVIGAELAAEYFNAQGGINGRMIELVIQDTGGDEAGAINAFQTLINEGVVAIMGPTLSQQAFAADPIAEQAGVPVVAPSNTARGIPEVGWYISRISSPVNVVAPNALRYALEVDPNITDVVVLYAQNDAFSSSETQVFQATVTELGLNLASVQTFQTTDTDFSVQVTNTIASNPQLVIISGLAADSGNLVKQLREFGYTGLIVGGNGLNSPNMFPVCQASCEGIIVAQAYSYEADTPINRTFRELFNENQGKEPGQFNGQAFTGIQVIVEALMALDASVGLAAFDEMSDPLTQLRRHLNAQILYGTYETPLGSISFTPTGEIIQAQFYVAQIAMNEDGQTGAFVFVK